MIRILAALALAAAVMGCAKGDVLKLEGTGYQVSMSGLVAGDPDAGVAEGEVWAGARIPPNGPGVFSILVGKGIIVMMKAGESYEEARERALLLLEGEENPAN